ncbi:D-2-hydroxyacid dehydrogenase [bacterium C-53]|nr:D-2-hydroxyacid dehydrogenase [Lachnospiraceae bacterium]NBI03042.1 D-2-hydroxyacid dehydrogenase [Lachnospiraceae bacterium]RKJ10738.1 D-2-hydroxyacid dehydrogenase [bacterium C-53]
MKIVMLERNSLGVDIDVSRFADFGPFEEYPVSVLNDTAEKVKDAEVIIVNKVPMDQRTLSEASNLKLICETATGTDNIDLDYCRSRGITVTNVKGYSTDTVAQHTFALLFYVMEKLRWYDDYVKSGEYSNQPRFSNFDQTFFEMKGRTWGIIGLGEIGRSVASIATAFGMNVIYYSASGRSYDVPYKCVDFDTLLKSSDIVSIHAPLNEYTRNLMNYEAFCKMKPSAYLINVGRGPIINDEDLARALNENKIAGAGLDVLGVEPMDKNNPLGRIQDSRKLIITPHMAWASVEARERLVNEVYENLKAYCAGEERSVVR